jgi:ATP-dependent RNA helicase DDX51/DBP6
MFGVARYQGGDDDDFETGNSTVVSGGLDSVLERAKLRQKRKRQEETFESRLKESNNVARNAKNKASAAAAAAAALRPVRTETLEERNARKADMRANRKNKVRDDGSQVENGEQSPGKIPVAPHVEAEATDTLKEIVTGQKQAAKSNTDKKKKVKSIQKDSIGSDASENHSKLSTAQAPALSERNEDEPAETGELSEGEEMDTAQAEATASATSKAEPAAFVKQLTRASKDAVTRAIRIEDEDDEAMDAQEPIAPAPPPMSVDESLKHWQVSQILIDNLSAMGITDFFPVQRSVIPSVIRSHRIPYMQPRDICVSAPTGSGKTIAYSLPILQTLLNREVVRLRALILVPSRDLAIQVHTVLKKLAKNTGLKLAMVTGQQSFEEEQSLLVGNMNQTAVNPRSSVTDFSFSEQMTNLKHWKFSRASSDGSGSASEAAGISDYEGHSLVDVLVCTPGRLVDHLQYTAGFTLQHVRFLVLDEADRLLSNAYHGWIKSVVQGVQALRIGSDGNSLQKEQKHGGLNLNSDLSIAGFLNKSASAPLQRMLFSATLTDNPRKLAMLNIRHPEVIRARAADAGGSSRLEDDNFGAENEDVDERGEEAADIISGFMLPSTLSESMASCDAARRPILLTTVVFEALRRTNQIPYDANSSGDGELPSEIHARHSGHIICNEPGDMVLVFASSVNTVHRLSHLLKLINQQDQDLTVNASVDATVAYLNRDGIADNLLFGGGVAEINRTVKADDREKIMNLARSGKIAVLVASDNLARGIDLPNIKLVINYDPPKFPRSYVHRVGRTARANRSGHCLTLLKEGQVGAFRKMRSQISSSNNSLQAGSNGQTSVDNSQVNKCKPSKTNEARVSILVTAALKLLPSSLAADND